MGFEWDEDKNERNRVERGLDFSLAEAVFQGETLTFEDTRLDYGEPRFVTFGQLDGRLVVVTHTPRGANTRIISMRKGNSREQKTYQARVGQARRDER